MVNNARLCDMPTMLSPDYCFGSRSGHIVRGVLMFMVDVVWLLIFTVFAVVIVINRFPTSGGRGRIVTIIIHV